MPRCRWTQTPALNITKVVNDVDGDTTAPVADAAGDVVTYTIRVANTGNTTLTGVTVTDTLDPTVTFVSGDTRHRWQSRRWRDLDVQRELHGPAERH